MSMTREKVIESEIDNLLGDSNLYCYVWISGLSVEIKIYSRLGYRMWVNRYNLELLDQSDESIAWRVFTEYTFG